MEQADDSPNDLMRIDHSPQTLREVAVARLRSAIIAGRFASGARLVERSLCDQLGVSRSVVREAIRYLEAEGLVEIAPRSGPVVARLDWDRARQIYDIRLLLESAAAADCARRATDRDRAALRIALGALDRAFAAGAPGDLYDATTAFYEVIFTAAGHTIAWEVVRRLNSRISRLRALTLATSDRRVSGPAHMARIAAAILQGDADGAAQAVRDHLTDAAAIAHALLTEPDGGHDA